MTISVVIPSYNPDPDQLRRLYQSLLAQTHADFEAVVVDDASPCPDYSGLSDPRFRVLRLPQNAGPAAARNAGAAVASNDILFFTDTDCELDAACLAHVARWIRDEGILVGDTRTRVQTAFGRLVALLGFPGGGALGFHNVWRVDAEGYTRSFSSCNLAFRKSLFQQLGAFNETFPVAGGEDTVLARHAVDSGCKIRYVPEQVVHHVERATLRSFVRWQLVRGEGNYYIKRHVPEVGGYLKLRIWTYRNSMAACRWWERAPVTLLWVLSVLLQTWGYWRTRADAVNKQ